MADAMADLVISDHTFFVNANTEAIHEAMKTRMPDYYLDQQIKDRSAIRLANRAKRWESGRRMIGILTDANRHSTEGTIS